jgi:hypothetical protein
MPSSGPYSKKKQYKGIAIGCNSANWWGKSLVFMVLAMLSRSRVTTVVALYAELKRQLVTRCIDAGMDCKHWPEARESWPRVVLVLAEAASSDDFLQWAADLRVRGCLDRVVVDECHPTFTTADEYGGSFGGGAPPQLRVPICVLDGGFAFGITHLSLDID